MPHPSQTPDHIDEHRRSILFYFLFNAKWTNYRPRFTCTRSKLSYTIKKKRIKKNCHCRQRSNATFWYTPIIAIDGKWDYCCCCLWCCCCAAVAAGLYHLLFFSFQINTCMERVNKRDSRNDHARIWTVNTKQSNPNRNFVFFFFLNRDYVFSLNSPCEISFQHQGKIHNT